MKLVDLSDYGFIIEPRYYFYGWSKDKNLLARKNLAEKLKLAKSLLAKDYNFKIWSAYRNLKTQILMIKSFYRRIKLLNPTWPKKKIWKEVFKFAGQPKLTKRLNSHFTGGALDLTIVNKDGRELDMGTDFDDLTEIASLYYFEKKKYLTKKEIKIRNNRRLLVKVMSKTGFKPYLPEWWHWSYNK